MTVGFVEAGGVPLAYEERGTGAPVVLVHGTATDRSLWAETIAALGTGFRTIAYDRRAYGESGAPEPYGGTTVEEQAEDAAGLIEALGARRPVLCGHDLGAVVCLDLVRRRPDVVRAALLIEPPLHSLSPHGAEVVGTLREAIEGGAREAGPAGAVEAFLLGTAGDGAIGWLGPQRAAAARSAARAFAADLAAAPTWQFGRRDLRQVAVPLIVLAGSRSAPVWRQIAEELASMLPTAELRSCHAGHLAPLEAPHEVAAAIRELSDRRSAE